MRPVQIPQERQAIEDMIERLIARLDAMDGDPDLEPGTEAEEEPPEATVQRLSLAPCLQTVRLRRRA